MPRSRPDVARDLPVDPERLRRQFPDLDEGDLEAYVSVTRRILGQADPKRRAGLTRDVLARARRARETGAKDDDDRLALRYLAAVEKMQAPRPS